MFGLFRKKKPRFPVVDRIWISQDARERAMVKMILEDPSVIFIHWFDESYDRSLHALGQSASDHIYMLRDAWHHRGAGKKLIFFEHYPLREKEQQAFDKMHLQKAEVWSALDEPLLLKFGGARLVDMMQKMGMKEDEAIEHALISRSITKAQDKITKQVTFDRHAGSMASWFEQNLV